MTGGHWPTVLVEHGRPGMVDGLTYAREALGIGRWRAEALDERLSRAAADGASYDQLVAEAEDARLSPDEAADLAGHYHFRFRPDDDRDEDDGSWWTAPEDGRHVRGSRPSTSTKGRRPVRHGAVRHRIRRDSSGHAVGAPAPTRIGGGPLLAAAIVGDRLRDKARKTSRQGRAQMRRSGKRIVRWFLK
jgi:hypothetical protein